MGELAQAAVRKPQKRGVVLVQAERLEGLLRFALPAAAVVPEVPRRQFLPVFFQPYAVRVPVAVGEVDDVYQAAKIVDPAHQPAGTEDFVVRVGSDDQQTRVRGDGQCPRHGNCSQRGQQGKQERTAHSPDEPASLVPVSSWVRQKPDAFNAPGGHPV